MNSIHIVNAFHQDRHARFTAEAHHARIFREVIRSDERRIRRAIGRSIVRFGARIAAEPAAERLAPAGTR